MRNATKLLQSNAQALVAVTRNGIDWLNNPVNESRLGEAKGALGKELRRAAVEAAHLVEASTRPMAVAVFGASQVGKSHLISVLARTNDQLYAVFDGVSEPVSYINKINIDKGTESTGVVTRFTLRTAPAPAGFPVCLRLLSHTDIVKILANAYFFDGKPNTFPEREEIERHLDRFRGRTGGRADNGLRIEDVWDLQDYFKQYLSDSALTGKLGSFWLVAEQVFEALGVEELGDFFSLLWGEHKAITKLYVDLAGGLQKLGFASDAFVPLGAIDATDPAIISLVVVDGLNDIAAGSQQRLDIRTLAGAVASLPRSTVAALTAELWITVRDKPWDFFDHTDLLDFPGYRSRGLKAADIQAGEGDEGQSGLARYLALNPDMTLKTLLLRGKVEYLFQRYVAEQEITSMLLCSKPSNMDVDQLPQVVAKWISVTHGARPQDRPGKEVLLFFVLTMFDMHFEQKQSDESFGLAPRFEGRMKASLLDPFGNTPDTWVKSWTPGEPFRNTFLMRNPNIKNLQVFQFEGGREAAVRPDQEAFIDALKTAFCTVPAVGEHFTDAARAFDEMMKLNDGGAQYIAQNLAPVCDPMIKERQIAFRLQRLKARLHERLARYYVASDVSVRLTERRQAAEWIMDELYLCDEAQRFASFLRGLMLDSGRISDQLHAATLNRAVPVAQPAAGASPAEPAARQRPGIGRARPGAVSADTTVLPATGSASAAAAQASRERLLAEAAFAALVDNFYERADDPHFSRFAGMSADGIREVANELVSAARRVDLVSVLERQILRIAFVDRRDQMIDKASVAAEQVLNRFVSDFGTTVLLEKERPVVEVDGRARSVFAARPTAYDTLGIKLQPDRFRERYVDDWINAFYQAVESNALSDNGGGVDPLANAQLGDILQTLSENV
ncbi:MULTISPECIES: putative virulence factor [Rhizobium]|uniref:Virulence factor n=1 Tax=Rhizobium aouanii TaxID=3118145 RepID=A0ABU8CVM1_9HYPH|nr:putative virulence factor [Rhizobium acaciae]MCW1754165.1 putative virulence factor [Rhizobium acaciae]